MLIQFLLWCMTGCLAFARVQHLGNLDFRQIRVFVFVLPVSSRELEVFATCNIILQEWGQHKRWWQWSPLYKDTVRAWVRCNLDVSPEKCEAETVFRLRMKTQVFQYQVVPLCSQLEKQCSLPSSFSCFHNAKWYDLREECGDRL